jgi:GNAT superfamily N-acetyltransferase
LDLTLHLVASQHELDQFVTLPWSVNRGDPHWVPPLIADRKARVDLRRNPFWRSAERCLWIARRGTKAVGSIAAIIDSASNRALQQPVGYFGFFECINDQSVANLLLETAHNWVKGRGMNRMRGPYNPSHSDEMGILIHGFNSRPALLEAHNPPYYAALLENAGFTRYNDLVARHYRVDPAHTTFNAAIPSRLMAVAERASQRKDLTVRQINMKRWDEETATACAIYNQSLQILPDYVPISETEFQEFAASFKPIMDPGMALIAEIQGKPVGFALALPDVNEALQRINGHLWPFGFIKYWWYSQRLTRATFKILMVLPEYHYRGVDAVLIVKAARAVWDRGFREVDLSLMGDENVASNRLQANLGFEVYRRYRIYEKITA